MSSYSVSVSATSCSNAASMFPIVPLIPSSAGEDAL